MTSKRKTVKAGKHERIRKLLNNIRATQPEPMVREQPWYAEALLQSRSSTPVNARTMNSSSAANE